MRSAPLAICGLHSRTSCHRVIYNAVTAVQAVGWILVSGAALRGGLTRDQKSTLVMRNNHRNGYVALAVYSLLALIALWFPLGIAIVTTMLWAYWLAFGVRADSAPMWPAPRPSVVLRD